MNEKPKPQPIPRGPGDNPMYVREPLTVSPCGRYFSIDAAKISELEADYRRWGLDKKGRGKGG